MTVSAKRFWLLLFYFYFLSLDYAVEVLVFCALEQIQLLILTP